MTDENSERGRRKTRIGVVISDAARQDGHGRGAGLVWPPALRQGRPPVDQVARPRRGQRRQDR